MFKDIVSFSRLEPQADLQMIRVGAQLRTEESESHF